MRKNIQEINAVYDCKKETGSGIIELHSSNL